MLDCDSEHDPLCRNASVSIRRARQVLTIVPPTLSGDGRVGPDRGWAA